MSKNSCLLVFSRHSHWIKIDKRLLEQCSMSQRYESHKIMWWLTICSCSEFKKPNPNSFRWETIQLCWMFCGIQVQELAASPRENPHQREKPEMWPVWYEICPEMWFDQTQGNPRRFRFCLQGVQRRVFTERQFASTPEVTQTDWEDGVSHRRV